MTDFVACYEKGIKLRTLPVHLVFCTNLSKCVFSFFTRSNLATPQAGSKLENTEGNRNQARCCLANMPNHGQLSGGPALSAKRYNAMGPRGRRCRGNGSNERTKMAALTQRQSDYSFSTIWVSHLLSPITVYQVLITIIITIHTAGCSPLG